MTDLTYNNEQMALAALANHPGFSILMDYLKAREDDAADRLFHSTTETEERVALQSWRGLRGTRQSIADIAETAKAEVSVETVDPTTYEQVPHQTRQDFEAMLAGIDTDRMLSLFTENATLEVGEET